MPDTGISTTAHRTAHHIPHATYNRQYRLPHTECEMPDTGYRYINHRTSHRTPHTVCHVQYSAYLTPSYAIPNNHTHPVRNTEYRKYPRTPYRPLPPWDTAGVVQHGLPAPDGEGAAAGPVPGETLLR